MARVNMLLSEQLEHFQSQGAARVALATTISYFLAQMTRSAQGQLPATVGVEQS